MKSDISGWGRYPKMSAEVGRPETVSACRKILSLDDKTLARGLGRSYGDSAIAPHLTDITALNHLLSFDSSTGLLSCQAGVSLKDILSVFVPQGWFLPVTPGTRFVTIGGAIASDIHGKNHHIDGTFCEHVSSLTILLGNGDILTCSRDHNADLFHATCGGMGLTGIVLSASFRLKKIASSDIIQTTIKCAALEETLAQFDKYSSSAYSVAWIDCLAKGKNLGRSLLMLGEHAAEGGLTASDRKPIAVPFDLPNFALKPWSVKAFNFFVLRKSLS